MSLVKEVSGGVDEREQTFPPSDEDAKQAHIDIQGYQKAYAESISDLDAFWAKHGKRID